MDMDIVLTDMAFDIPFQKYDGKDFIIWGNRDNVLKGDVYQGPSSLCYIGPHCSLTRHISFPRQSRNNALHDHPEMTYAWPLRTPQTHCCRNEFD